MNISTAFLYLKNGFRIRRSNCQYYFDHMDYENGDVKLSIEDMIASDWIIVFEDLIEVKSENVVYNNNDLLHDRAPQTNYEKLLKCQPAKSTKIKGKKC